jgi:hypothetical protein
MRVSLSVNFDKEQDGHEGYMSYDRDGIEDLYELSNFLYDAAVAMGFHYVKAIYFVKSDGSEIGSDI